MLPLWLRSRTRNPTFRAFAAGQPVKMSWPPAAFRSKYTPVLRRGQIESRTRKIQDERTVLRLSQTLGLLASR